MALYNIVCAVTNTLGISDVVIGAAVSGYKSFADVPNGAVVSYGIRERANASGAVLQSEVGTGTWNSATLTLSRTVTDSTNAGSKIILVTGYAEVYITPLAADFHNPVTIGTANGLSLVAQALSLGLASAGVTGALSGTDWSTFDNKLSVESDPVFLASVAAAITLGDIAYWNAKQPPLGYTPVNIASADWIDLTDGGATTLHTHTGFEPTITILPASKGGTGIANGASATLTLPNLAITLGGGGAAQTYTLPAAGGTFSLLNAANVFTTNQMIDLSSDVIGLRVQGHSTQTANLQTWENSGGTVYASVTGLGQWSISPPAFVLSVANSRGVTVSTSATAVTGAASGNTFGIDFTTTINSTTANASGIHTGGNFNSLGGNVDVGRTIDEVAGVKARAYGGGSVFEGTITRTKAFVTDLWGINASGVGIVTNAYAFYAAAPTKGSGVVTNIYGIYLEDISIAAALNYAIYTNAGLVHFGDTVDLASGKNLTLLAGNITTDTTTGTKVATATTQKLGFWNVTPIVQPAGATQAAPAAYVTGAFGLDSSANMQALYDLVVAMRTALVNSGLIKGAA